MIIQGFNKFQWRRIQAFIDDVCSGRWQQRRNREEDITSDFVLEGAS